MTEFVKQQREQKEVIQKALRGTRLDTGPVRLLNHDQRRAFSKAIRRVMKGERLSDKTDGLVRRYIDVGVSHSAVVGA